MESAGRRANAALRFIVAIICALMLMMTSVSQVAWAQESTEVLENAGNVFAASDENSSQASKASVVRDFFWAGKDLDLASFDIGADMITAGMNLHIADTIVGGSVRMAGKDLSLSNVVVKNNITTAGENITLTSCAAEGGVYVAGANISYTGSCTGAGLAGNKIVLDGVVNGDAYIAGTAVEIGPNAVVTGTLKVTASSQPSISSSANINNYEFELAEDNPSGISEAEMTAAISGIALAITILMNLIGFLGTVVFAIVLVWLFRRPIENATAMTRVHAGRIFATGAIAAFCAPILFLLLLGLVITMPIAFALLAALITLTIISVPFAAAAFAKLVFPKMNRFGAAAIGAAVLGLVSLIPFIGPLLSLAAFMYIVGYVIQALWQDRKSQKAAQSETPQFAPPSTEPVATADQNATEVIVVTETITEEES